MLGVKRIKLSNDKFNAIVLMLLVITAFFAVGGLNSYNGIDEISGSWLTAIPLLLITVLSVFVETT
jgi:hypothetical protein